MQKFRVLLSLMAFAVPLISSEAAWERWLYLSINLQPVANITRAEALFGRASAAGYTHIFLADSKFANLENQSPAYRKNCERVRVAAARAGLNLVPALFGVGYSNEHLRHNPNLAEGLPVKDALFVVEKGLANVVADPPVSLPSDTGHSGALWKFVDETLVSENGALKASNPTGNARFHAPVQLAKFRQYTISVRIRTEDFQGKPEIKVLGPGQRPLNFTNLHVEATQDWTTHRITFNSLDNDKAGVYFGTWGAARGTIWWEDATISEEGMVNVLRREGCPLVVKTEDGRVLEESVDYEPVADPLLGKEASGGEDKVWHEAPALRTKLPDGTRLRVSYYHPHVIYDGQLCICPSEPETVELLRKQAESLNSLWRPDSFMMQHDEWRVLGWDAACLDRKLTPGELVADNARTCRKLLGNIAPDARIHVWSDMFDPHHNAVDGYYLVNGDLHGSWKGLDPSVVIVNWNAAKAAQSLPFFAARGHRQILAGYYDQDPAAITAWLAAARKVPGVIGVMYTTWEKDYSQLEEFSRLVSESEKAASSATP